VFSYLCLSGIFQQDFSFLACWDVFSHFGRSGLIPDVVAPAKLGCHAVVSPFCCLGVVHDILAVFAIPVPKVFFQRGRVFKVFFFFSPTSPLPPPGLVVSRPKTLAHHLCSAPHRVLFRNPPLPSMVKITSHLSLVFFPIPYTAAPYCFRCLLDPAVLSGPPHPWRRNEVTTLPYSLS